MANSGSLATEHGASDGGEERDQALVDETTERVIDDNGRVTDVKRDVPRYVQLVGRECIRGWEGVTDEAGNVVDCTPEAIDEFMQIQPAREFVLGKVRGLDLWLRGETDAAKKG